MTPTERISLAGTIVGLPHPWYISSATERREQIKALNYSSENPQTAVEQPDIFLKVLGAFLKAEDISELEQKDRKWLLFLYRYGGIRFLNEDLEAKSFLRYVVGYFEKGFMSKNY